MAARFRALIIKDEKSILVTMWCNWMTEVPLLAVLVLSNESSLTSLWLVDVYLSSPLIFSQDYEEEEAEAFDVSLTKNTQGLGITIAGYVGDKNSGEKSQNKRPFKCHIDV